MPEYSRFFDSTPDDERYYSADEFAEYFRRLLTNGIFNGGTNLQVGCDGNNIMTYVNEGFAWIEGYMYKIEGGPFYLTHDLPDTQYDRIDRIVLRLDKSLEVRAINAKVLKGTPAANPVPPALTRNDNVYEISLAQIRILKGKSYIEGFQITDERLDASVCGLVNSLIQADTTEIFNQFQAWYNSKTAQYQNDWNNWYTAKIQALQAQWDSWFNTNTTNYNNSWNTWFNTTQNQWNSWFSNVQNTGFETPSGAQAKVAAAIAAHSADTAAHGIGNKSTLLTTNKNTIVEAINELFTFANDGKTSIASVIGSPATSGDTFATLANHIQNAKNTMATNLTNKGTSANGTETLQSLANKIANVNTGKQVAYGNTNVTIPSNSGLVSLTVPISVSFTPKEVILLLNSWITTNGGVDEVSLIRPLLHKGDGVYLDNFETTVQAAKYGNIALSAYISSFNQTSITLGIQSNAGHQIITGSLQCYWLAIG